MARRARQLDIEIGCWFSPHFSPRSTIFKEHPEWLLRAADGRHWGGGYGDAIVTADWTTGVYDWVLGDLRRWTEEGGLDYIFMDSWANMGLLQMNYADHLQTNWQALGRLLADIQKLGVKAYSFEGVSALGVSRFGCCDMRGDMLAASQGVVGQNDFGWFAGDLDMAYNLNLDVGFRKRTAVEKKRFLFTALANRGGFIMSSLTEAAYTLPSWAVRLFNVYEQVLPGMRHRRLLPQGRGVLWNCDEGQVLWAYKEFSHVLDANSAVSEVTGNGIRVLCCSGRLPAKAGKVYRIAAL